MPFNSGKKHLRESKTTAQKTRKQVKHCIMYVNCNMYARLVQNSTALKVRNSLCKFFPKLNNI